MFYGRIITVISFVLFPLIGIILASSSCPHLQPNKNVLIICYTIPELSHADSQDGDDDSGIQPEYLRCDSRGGHVNISTIAIYQCDRYYKPAARRFNGGKLKCTANGWTKIQAFRDFHCELDCGKQPEIRNALIESGKPTHPKFWPWIATIYKRNNEGIISYTCGGSLIGLRTVLTVAHCVSNITITKIVLGSVSSDLEQNKEKAGASVHKVKEIFIHPKFNGTTLENDIAIIELEETANLTELILPVCLPISSEQDSLITSPENFGEIASFGSNRSGIAADTLQYMRAEIQNPATCYSVMKKVPTPEQYCAGSRTQEGLNLCKGDSGSGMFFKYKDTNNHVIHGLVSSTGNIRDGCGPLVIFPKVYSYIEWIHEIMTATENPLSQFAVPNEDDALEGSKKDNCFGTKCNSTGIVESGISSTMVPNLEPEYTEDEKLALGKLRRMLKRIKLETYMYRDQYLIRFLRSNEFKLEETKDALKANMEWRKANRINEIVNEDFTQFRKDYTVFQQGFDKEGRPVTTSLLGLWKVRKSVLNGEAKQFERYIIRNMEEQEIRIRAVGMPNVTQSINILDMHGFDVKELLCVQCFNVYVNNMKVFDKYYPQQAHVMYFINVPSISSRAFHALFPHVSHYTLNHIKLFGPSKEIWSKELLKQIPSDQLFRAYGGTMIIQEGSDKIQLAL